MFIFTTVGNSVYVRTPLRTLCSDVKYEIQSEKECKEAGALLGFQWAESWDGTNQFPACLHAPQDNKIYFNRSTKPRRASLEKFSAICKAEGKNNHL